MHSYEQTSQALWILSNHIHRQVDREEFQAFDDIETTQAVKFRIMRRLFGGEWASLKQRITTHQFVEKHRVVIVFKSLVAGEGPLSGIQTDETGWITLQPSSTGHGTVVELCLKQVPLHLNSPMPEPAAQQFNDMLKSVVQESNLEIFTAAEALLLEYAMIGINLLARRARRR
ncbi:hypothetical protein P3T76_014953 [Phytophthora citrophthora]|uniref:Uncharacterized protein n=1 Tax=Phytophthora citrophthora TaxID=4793 RepID=A0AAD9LAQ1_9STRA|nr:hypothetical protein P3T76_014953 [Phytophthora citrophthora]